MGSEGSLQGVSLLQLTEVLLSKSDQVHLQRSSDHLRATGSHPVGGVPLELQCIGEREPKHSASSCELTNTLWTTISRISSSINEMRPVYRLPPEVLVEVLTWYRRLESRRRNDKWFTWVRLMSVSHRWRATILSFPSLWSVVHFNGELSPGTVRMLLGRSGEHPLDVVIPGIGCTPKSIRYSHARDASAHTSRIRKFLIYPYMVGNDVKDIVKIFSRPAPNLTHLKIIVVHMPGDTISFPDLFGLEFPQLRVLKVAGVRGWPKIVGANITHITVNDSLNLRVLKDSILHSPNLKALKIQGVWIFDTPATGTLAEPITLPPGVRLSIRRTRSCSRILELFALPRDGHIIISPNLIQLHEMPLLSHVLPTDISHLQNLHTTTRFHVKARIDFCVTLGLRCFRLDRPAFEVDVMYIPEGRTVPQASLVMRFLCELHQIVLRGVEELRMDGFVGGLAPQEAELLGFLKGMPALKRVITTDGNEAQLLSVLDSLGCQAIVVRVEE